MMAGPVGRKIDQISNKSGAVSLCQRKKKKAQLVYS